MAGANSAEKGIIRMNHCKIICNKFLQLKHILPVIKAAINKKQKYINFAPDSQQFTVS